MFTIYIEEPWSLSYYCILATLTFLKGSEFIACPVTNWSRIVVDPAHHAERAVGQLAQRPLDAEREIRRVVCAVAFPTSARSIQGLFAIHVNLVVSPVCYASD